MVVKASKDKPKVRTYNKGSGLPGFLGEIGNFFGDVDQQTRNFDTSVGDYFSGTTTPNENFKGNLAYGLPPLAAGTLSKPQEQGRPKKRPELATEPETPQLSFADYLAMANEYLGGGTPDYGAMEQYLRGNAANSDSRLEAMYRQLRGSIDADAAGITQNYDGAAQAVGSNADLAAKNTAQGYSAAREAQSKQLAALGIEDAAGVLASNGGQAAGDQAAANAGIEANRLAGQQQATANKASAVNYNTNIGNAAGLEGSIQRSLVQQKLAESLASLQMQQEQDAVQSKQSQFSTALQLKGMDDSMGAGAAAAAQQDFDNQLAVARLKLDEAKASGSSKTLEQALANYTQLQQVAQGAGIGNDPDSFGAFLKNLQSAGSI